MATSGTADLTVRRWRRQLLAWGVSSATASAAAVLLADPPHGRPF